MPSSSKAQADLMRAVSHDPKFARKVGIKQSVGRDFEAADKAAGEFQARPTSEERAARRYGGKKGGA
jgi:hypothetical protein